MPTTALWTGLNHHFKLLHNTSVQVGEWIAVSWGGSTNRPNGCSFHLSLVSDVHQVVSIEELDQFRSHVVEKILSLYDHKELTELDFVPEAFLRQVIDDFSSIIQDRNFRLNQVNLRDHDQWEISMTVTQETNR